jgi:hydroxymethylglutaryl-CoA reductase
MVDANSVIQNFSKLSKHDKIKSLATVLSLPSETIALLAKCEIDDSEIAHIINDLSENTLSHFPSPYGIAPNFLINSTRFHVPMVTEESSVVAAAAKAAKIWASRGGFHSNVTSLIKTGHVHFIYKGSFTVLEKAMIELVPLFFRATSVLTENMRKRGGGILSIELVDKTSEMPNYYQLLLKFNTADAMGANFINSCLEEVAAVLKNYVASSSLFADSRDLDIVMAILSNYNPDCIVEAYVECSIRDLDNLHPSWSGDIYSSKFKTAVDIANCDVSRAVTHNKGIMNGIDAVAIATGNDYRAIEAGVHAFASKSGRYTSLTKVELSNKTFRYTIEIPLAVGTIGGITGVHPLTKLSMQILQKPTSNKLMQIMASVGLASNFSAVHALITTGIQKGHMKLHLANILNQLKASEAVKQQAILFFQSKTVSFTEVEKFVNQQS